MKKLLSILAFFLILIPSFIYGQVHYDYPKCNSQADKNIKIVRIICEVWGTVIDFEYNRSESQGIYILLSPPNTDGAYYIKANGRTYKLISTSGIGNKNGVTPAEQNKPVYFSATFEPLPISVKEFDLIEGKTGSWHFYGIQLTNPSNNTGINSKPSSNTISKPSNPATISKSSNSNIANPNSISNLDEWKEYFKNNISKIDNIEGVYKSSWYSIKYYEGKLMFDNALNDFDVLMPYIVLLKINNEYKRFVVTDISSFECDVILRTYSESKFIGKRDKPTGTYMDNPEIFYSNGEFSFSYTLDYNSILDEYIKINNENNYNLDMLTLKLSASKTKRIMEQNMVKIYPTLDMMYDAKETKIQKTSSTGTGFAIASNGYIITCNHVIDDATSIKVKGINGNFTKAYTATVSSSDKNNDLAILKINDASFSSLGPIPYTIKTPTSDVGTSIFIMGYPLTATMGDEVKLTDGIISAKSGFTGDITSYQISAAAQPGNSGGPLFDKTGNLIGVVNAKHVKAENATYAVKSSYLQNLIESLPTTPVLQKVNTLTGKTLPEQVKLIKNFVYIIEVN